MRPSRAWMFSSSAARFWKWSSHMRLSSPRSRSRRFLTKSSPIFEIWKSKKRNQFCIKISQKNYLDDRQMQNWEIEASLEDRETAVSSTAKQRNTCSQLRAPADKPFILICVLQTATELAVCKFRSWHYQSSWSNLKNWTCLHEFYKTNKCCLISFFGRLRVCYSNNPEFTFFSGEEKALVETKKIDSIKRNRRKPSIFSAIFKVFKFMKMLQYLLFLRCHFSSSKIAAATNLQMEFLN